MNKSDIPLICNYWLNSDVSFLKGMGVDLTKLPRREDLSKMLDAQLDKPINERQSYALIWLLEDKPVGHCNVNPFTFGESGTMHLHLWRSDNRRKGMGTELVRMSIVHFFNTLELKVILSEPYALNHAPNKTLEKCGFKRVKNYITVPGSLNFEQEVNRWELKKPLRVR